MSAGKVELGAFRTYPEGYKPATKTEDFQSIPLAKIEDFGVHCDQYYQLEIEYFKSSLDQKLLENLWNKYWIGTLSSSSLCRNWDFRSMQMDDLGNKIDNVQSGLGIFR